MIKSIWEHNGKYNEREKTELWQTQNNDYQTVINVTPKSILFIYSYMKMTPLHDDLFLHSEYSCKIISTYNIFIIIYGLHWLNCFGTNIIWRSFPYCIWIEYSFLSDMNCDCEKYSTPLVPGYVVRWWCLVFTCACYRIINTYYKVLRWIQ